jgi:hypothetical protein
MDDKKVAYLDAAMAELMVAERAALKVEKKVVEMAALLDKTKVDKLVLQTEKMRAAEKAALMVLT